MSNPLVSLAVGFVAGWFISGLLRLKRHVDDLEKRFRR